MRAVSLSRASGPRPATGLFSLCCGILLSILLAAAAHAGVKTKVLADGTTLIYNETERQKARRTASRLLAVPQSEISYYIERHAHRQGLSQRLVQAVVQVESGYNAQALSRKGAMGLMQLMPGTATLLGVSDAYDPEQNVRGGTTYLRRMLDRYDGDLELALAAYNAGPTAVDRHRGIPPYPETERYVKKVLGLYHSNGAPSLLQDHARDEARKRARAQTAVEAEKNASRGRKVYLVRDENNRVVMTTHPPDSPG